MLACLTEVGQAFDLIEGLAMVLPEQRLSDYDRSVMRTGVAASAGTKGKVRGRATYEVSAYRDNSSDSCSFAYALDVCP